MDKADRNSASSAAARSRNLSRSRLFGSPGPIALIAECVEGCVAATPMTAAEKRCATSATTASSPAFDRSRRMQAIRIEIVVNPLSAAESRAISPPPDAKRARRKVCRSLRPCARSGPSIKARSSMQKIAAGVWAVRCGGEPGDRVRARRTSPGAPGTRQGFAVAASRPAGIRQSRRSWIFPRPRRPRCKARRRM